MEDQIIRKITEEIERGLTTESQVVYLLVEIRKFLERKGKNAPAYPSLKLHSDWVVHVALDRKPAQEIVKKADELYPKMIAGTMSEGEKAKFAQMFSLDRFRQELGEFLAAQGIRPLSDPEWNRLLACFLNVVEDCPLLCNGRAANLTHIDEVVVIRNPDRNMETPAVIWALCFGGRFKMSVGGIPKLSGETIRAIEAFSEARAALTIEE